MNNFPIEKDGKIYWVSRSMACSMLCYAFNGNGKLCVLANKRGIGAEYKPGYWNAPGGFIDYNETDRECACRELYEETGVAIDKDAIKFFCIDSVPNSERQTIAIRFCYLFNDTAGNIHTTSEHSEPDEVEEIRWIPCDEASLSKYQWTKDQIHYILLGKKFIKRKFFFRYLKMKICSM